MEVGKNMTEWYEWAITIFGFLLALIGMIYKNDKRRLEDCVKSQHQQSERLATIEAILDREKEAYLALSNSINTLSKDLQETRIILASIKGD